jgi:EAL domain-containing protein (putative c-di-GMP-specific phosphodiesterase class I)
LLHETKTVIDKLSKLKALGVAIVMDDFGTGCSSLSCLWRFPFDKIKVDRNLMVGLDTNRDHVERIVRTVMGIGRSLHTPVTVEGVESTRQLAFVRDVCCDQVQGFFFGRPVGPADVTRHFVSQQRKNK